MKLLLRKGIALQALVGSVIVLSMLILAAALVGLSYINSRETLVQQVEQSAILAAKAVDNGILDITGPVIHTLQLLELDPLASAESFDSRMARLPILVRTLEVNELISAVYYGYENGDFFLLRRIPKDQSSTAFFAPPESEYMLQSISTDPQGNKQFDWIVYGADLTVLNDLSPNEYRYDPRQRPWFQSAKKTDDLVITSPYVFFTTKEVGITFAIHNQQNGAVVGVDAALKDLSEVLRALKPSNATELVLTDAAGYAIAYPETERLVYKDDTGRYQLKNILELGVPALSELMLGSTDFNKLTPVLTKQAPWYGLKFTVGNEYDDWQLLFAIPKQELFAAINKHLYNQLVLSSVIIVILVIAGWIMSRSISKPLQALSNEVSALASYDFNRTINVSSSVYEVRQLAKLIGRMSTAIRNFQSISKKLARTPDLDMTLDQISQHLIAITSAKSGAVYLYNQDDKRLSLATNTELKAPVGIHCDSLDWVTIHSILQHSIRENADSLFITPLIDRTDNILGALVLLLPNRSEEEDVALYHFIEEISGTAATAIATRRQFEAQQSLLDSIIKLLADAIDAKSPYTSGHCERVPVLAESLAEAAIQSTKQPFQHFTLSESERREFQIAAWLHDCGKLTSPEYIIDKATKLETVYNRIHEVRTRFEVLWRDADIAYLEGIIAGNAQEKLDAIRAQRREQLQNDFALVAKANIGGEYMSEEDIKHIEALAQQTWVRHFSALKGLSRAEYDRIPDKTEHLPTTERLLADKDSHLEPWQRRPPVEKNNPENIWGFDMTLPDHYLNHGELYNLRIARGTLTAEERFIVNDHIVQTIRMLASLPLPDNLAHVPDIAGNHHEKLSGDGYPRKLNAEHLSIPARIMAIADVFEALTANDRPYKEAKKLSEAMSIMAFMVKDQHLDADLFKLFLDNELYAIYAENYLMEKQKDSIDVADILRKANILTDHPSLDVNEQKTMTE